MAIIRELAERRALIGSAPPRDPVLAEWLAGGTATASGEVVSATTAMRESTFLAGVRYISETLASLPLILYRRRLPRGKDRAVDLPLYERLHDQPNRWQTSFEWRDMLLHNLILRGNLYCQIVESRELPPFELIPLHPDRVMPFWVRPGVRAYAVQRDDGGRDILLQEEVLHISFMPKNGLMGVSVLHHARETIGRALAAERYGARFFANDARPGGVLTTPKALSNEAKKRLREQWEERFRGADNARKVAVLEEGMQWQNVGIAPEDAQFLGTMEFGVEDIARILRIPPHKVGALRRATFSNIEHQAIEAVVDCIRPWAVRLEQGLNMALLRPEQRRSLFVKFLLDGLLRGDFESRNRAYATGRQWGWLSPNDIRELEDLNPIDGGDVYHVPLNMVPLNQVGQPSAGLDGSRASPRLERRQADAAAEAFRRLREAWRPRFEAAVRDVLSREADEIQRRYQDLSGNRSLADFTASVDEFYASEAGRLAFEGLAPVAHGYAQDVAAAAGEAVGGDADAAELASFVDSYLASYAVRHVSDSRAEVLQAVQEGPQEETEARLSRTLDRWRSERPGTVARHETVQAGNAIARRAWILLGVLKLRWVTFDPCPLCAPLSGRVVGSQQPFVGDGEVLDAGPGKTPLISKARAHPPLHDGCECQVLPSI